MLRNARSRLFCCRLNPLECLLSETIQRPNFRSSASHRTYKRGTPSQRVLKLCNPSQSLALKTIKWPTRPTTSRSCMETMLLVHKTVDKSFNMETTVKLKIETRKHVIFFRFSERFSQSPFQPSKAAISLEVLQQSNQKTRRAFKWLSKCKRPKIPCSRVSEKMTQTVHQSSLKHVLDSGDSGRTVSPLVELNVIRIFWVVND